MKKLITQLKSLLSKKLLQFKLWAMNFALGQLYVFIAMLLLLLASEFGMTWAGAICAVLFVGMVGWWLLVYGEFIEPPFTNE